MLQWLFPMSGRPGTEPAMRRDSDFLGHGQNSSGLLSINISLLEVQCKNRN